MKAAFDTAALWLEAQAIVETLPTRSWQKLTQRQSAMGLHARKRSGEGQEFWQYRQLGDGDSATNIDWRKSARGDSLLQREREQQSRQQVWLWCDMSGSMHYRGSRSARSKAAQAYLLAASLVQLAAQAGEEIKLAVAGATSRVDLPMRLAEPLTFAPERVPADAILILISDFIAVQFEALPVTIFSLHIADPDELDFPFDGAVRFEGLENEPHVQANQAQSLREAYLGAQAELQKQIATASAFSCLCNSADAPAASLLELLERIGQ